MCGASDLANEHYAASLVSRADARWSLARLVWVARLCDEVQLQRCAGADRNPFERKSGCWYGIRNKKCFV